MVRATPPRRPTVLVVDDEEAIRRNFGAYLEDCGYGVLLAASGDRALAMVATERPDVIVTDLRMPGMHGRTLIEHLREHQPMTPVIVVSGTGDIKEAIDAIRCGAWDYLRKPVDLDTELGAAITRNIERARAQVESLQYQAQLEQVVTERTDTLREREQRLRIVADNTYDWEWWMAPDGQFLYCSPSCERITGYTREELVKDPGLPDRMVHPDDRDRLQLQVSAGQGAAGAVEFRIIHRDGSTRWLDLAFAPVFDEAGTYLGTRGSSRDITTRKALETQVLRMQRQESLGRLASGIAHDLNNVLAPIMMAGDLLKSAALNDNERECVEMVRASSTRGANLVRQLLLFSRGVDGRRTHLDPSRVVRDVARIISETFPKGIRLKLDLPTDPWFVEADQTQLHQVVLNLCVNARDAMPGGGALSLALERLEIDGEAALASGGLRPGSFVVLAVADTGSGIPADVLDKIFDPFFTTKPQGQGTGLGLSTVQGIVASHGGVIDVQTEVGKGTVFKVYLPLVGDPGASVDENDSSLEVVRGTGQTILVVDDERMVRNLTKRTLVDAGYRVLLAEGASQALDLYNRASPPVSLVLMDAWMPQVDGLSAVRRLARLDPEARVIVMSGLAEVKDQALRVSPVVKRFLLKPWRTVDLLALVHAVLTAPEERSET